ncbi:MULTISPECIES: aminoimidazole riboside kinase [unclassified Pseudocitrobacter]|uniref:aminoimidazole riboside kinase n=1 Tax=unclassified Pseudocitrobacter TaxID=2638778 RepID=UPI0023E3A041|nr:MULTISPECIES: aminoimidazole riboside kinase [unclassified Pseudocitrobacter]MDF3831181.1 aminoimidazole riboside kinase [Pseudocitrobacter sp. 2023EL-00150]MEC5376615.1 aminoimidazole riboside kinase [Pseudocitrobacter sp. MW920760]
MNAKVWVLGDAVVDLLPESEGRLLQCPGGAPANVAVGVARLGGNSGFIGRVGGDPFGRYMRHTLQQEQVDVSHMYLDDQQRTSTVVVDLDDQGERTFTFMVRPSADLFLTEEDLPKFTAGQWLHVCSIALSAEPSRSATFAAMENIKSVGGRISFDPNIRPDLWQDQALLQACLDRALHMANVVKLSEEELVFISGSNDLAQGIASVTERYQPELLLVTQGKAGVLAAFQQEFTHFNARPVISVDTTGAGDAFVAGLLASLAANGMPTDVTALESTLTLAQTCGALATTAKGAMTALPYQRDLNRQF